MVAASFRLSCVFVYMIYCKHKGIEWIVQMTDYDFMLLLLFRQVHMIPVGNHITKNRVQDVIHQCPNFRNFYTQNHRVCTCTIHCAWCVYIVHWQILCRTEPVSQNMLYCCLYAIAHAICTRNVHGHCTRVMTSAWRSECCCCCYVL